MKKGVYGDVMVADVERIGVEDILRRVRPEQMGRTLERLICQAIGVKSVARRKKRANRKGELEGKGE